MTRPATIVLAAALASVVGPAATRAAEPDFELIVERSLPLTSGDVAEAAPPTFVLLDDGQFYAGGSSEIIEGRLEGKELKALRQRIARVRKLKGLGTAVEFGPGAERCRVVFSKGQEITTSGDPGQAPFGVRPLASLIEAVSQFDDPSARLYLPQHYSLIVRPGSLVGGCRSWTFSLPLLEALPAPRVVPAEAALGWPTGVHPASVCAGEKTYVVALRPLLPWERPGR